MNYIALGDVAEIDRTVATEEECRTLAYVGLEHIEKETGRFAPEFARTPETLLASKFKFTPRHILYGKLRPYLNKVVRPNFDGVCSTDILPILPDESQLDRTFLWAIFLSPKFVTWASANVSGANLPRLDPKLLEDYPIPIPSLPEQRRIAALLDKADHLRRTRRYAAQLSDTFLQAVFVRMFGDPIANSKGLLVERLEDLIDPNRRITYGIVLPGDHIEDGIPYVRVVDMKDRQISLAGLRRTTTAIAESYKRSSLKPGDLLLSIRGQVGRLAIVPTYLDGANITQDTARLATTEKINVHYLMGCLGSTEMQDHMRNLTKGAAIKGIIEFSKINVRVA